MVALYCRKNHTISQDICPECSDLSQYCRDRLGNCPWGEHKPACALCTIHCYAAGYRERIQQVMRFSGPRIIFTRPLLAINHILHRFHNPPEKA